MGYWIEADKCGVWCGWHNGRLLATMAGTPDATAEQVARAWLARVQGPRDGAGNLSTGLTIRLTGPDAEQALAELQSNITYDGLVVKVEVV